MLEIKNLTKKYNKFVAVDDITFNINKGDIFGFIGPNGAGKTTTIKIISTLLKDFKGDVLVNNFNVKTNYLEVRKQIGYMPDFVGIYKNMTIYEYLFFFGRAYGLKGNELNKSINDCLELTGLIDLKNKSANNLSRGMTQRLILAKTLVHKPEFLLLDEPASGLDPRARLEFKNILKTLKSIGKTILISSHILSELYDICNSVGIIEHGKIIISGSIEKIKKKIRHNKIYIIKSLNEISQKIFQEIKLNKNIIDIQLKDSYNLELEIKSEEKIPDFIKFLFEKQIKIIEFKELDTNLEDVFMKITEGKLV